MFSNRLPQEQLALGLDSKTCSTTVLVPSVKAECHGQEPCLMSGIVVALLSIRVDDLNIVGREYRWAWSLAPPWHLSIFWTI
jgi:hypothetical protein